MPGFQRPRGQAGLVMNGVSLPIVQAILGRSTIAVTERYAHLAPHIVQQARDDTFGFVSTA